MNEPTWIWRQLSERADTFERLLQELKAHDYSTVTLAELYAHMSGEHTCAPKSVALVFDDGYLDNWVTVGPLLKKHGMSGTVYVNPEFVDPGDKLRPTLDDIQGINSGATDISQTGFMNWAELEHLDESGVLDVQSHSLTHTWHFTSPNIVDYYVPSTAAGYPWMAWNARPERKSFYMQEDQSCFVPWGTPVFEHEKSLIARRFIPDSDSIDDLVNAVAAQGGPNIFEHSNWRDVVQQLVESVTGGGSFLGTQESEMEYEARVRGELAQSKAIIEERLSKTVDFLCWPGGGTNAIAKQIAGEVGYKSWALPSAELRDKRNKPGEDPSEIKRLPAIRDVRFFNRNWGVGSERLVYLETMAHQESWAFGFLKKAYKLCVAFGIAGQR